MKLLVIGMGYVGLVTAACFAEMGHQVVCLDIDVDKINLLNRGFIDFHEPNLEPLVRRNCEAGRLIFTCDDSQALVASCSVCFITVPTPSTGEEQSCDLSHVMAAARFLAESIQAGSIVVIKSTVPVGTAKQVREVIQKHQKKGFPFEVVSNPEFLREGNAVADCMKPDRIILGVESVEAAKVMRKVYSSFTLNCDRILVMDNGSAEMTKYAANAMLASRISFMNEISRLCEKMRVNVSSVRVGIGSDRRIGHHSLYAGIGYGGACFPKDILALRADARRLGCETPLLEAIHQVNERQRELMVQKILSYFSGSLADKTVAIWGLSFKPDTDDLRESPALKIIKELLKHGACLRLYDPIAMPKARIQLRGIEVAWCQDEYEAARQADAILLATEWKQFRSVDLELLLKEMKGKAFFDGRNQQDKIEMVTKGFDYFGVGV